MSRADTTCWTVIKGAAGGSKEDKAEFARRYTSVIRAYLGSRWRGMPLINDMEDAVQDVFVDCFKPRGALEKVDPGRGTAFRAFLYGVVCNVARRVERRAAQRREFQAPAGFEADGQAGVEDEFSRVFDRAWAQAIMRQAADRQVENAKRDGPEAGRRVELVRLRFQEGMPIRQIAALWAVDAAHLHHEYAKARREFKRALGEVVAFHHPGPKEEIELECAELLALLK